MRRNHTRLAAAAAVAALSLIGCGGDDDADGGGAPPPGDGTPVHAKDSLEFDRELYTVPGGTIDFTYIDDGSLPHTLVVEDHEDDMRLEVTSGSTDSGSIDLEPGTYTLYCDVAGHRSGGMEARLVVE